ncbi:hypothetical protein Lal_00041477 [Lupinus albus]|nr:hypothetical protein Lal_00041477 [Lupinus albus]
MTYEVFGDPNGCQMQKKGDLSFLGGLLYFFGGRVVLINVVLNAMPIYLLSYFKAPRCVINKMIKIQRDFL